MKELLEWYWEHGIKRGTDPSDPDRELRKISIGSWLDPLLNILERSQHIRQNIKSKSCLALWGPSQTGKSTMMSRYIDGFLDDGADSALTWNDAHKTRFSPPQNGVNAIPAGTLVFNPFNHNSDASGVATRYILKSAASGEVNTLYPVELKLTNRAQIIQSLSLGYLSECEIDDESLCFTQESFLDGLASGETVNNLQKDAYYLLKDIADVIEFMRGNPRFSNLFKKGEWNRKVRKALVSSPKMLNDAREAEKFLERIFWDSNGKITQVYKKMNDILTSLETEWRNCRILSSLEVGALLLDIDSYKNYASSNDQSREVMEKVSNLSYSKEGNEIHIYIGNGGSTISGDNFGYFQALCSELVVPIKQEAIEAAPGKNKFLALAEKCDFLDFPGVSNKNTGNNKNEDSAASLVNLSKCDMSEIFTRVFKQGKTQCFVYNYVRKYGIDAFAVLVRTDRYPSKSSLLNAGICEWIRSFDPDWKPGRNAAVPVFVNMTFFASLINNVSASGAGSGGLRPYIDRIQGELTFASRESAKFFPTTYPQFHDGKIDNIAMQEETIQDILRDPCFTMSTGMTDEAIRSVYSYDGGVDYMLGKITESININRRKELCRDILSRDKAEFCRLIEGQLPSSEDMQLDDRKAALRKCRSDISAAIEKAEDDDDTDLFNVYANILKNLFSASPALFVPLPLNAYGKSKKEVKGYIREQLAKWYEFKLSNLEESDFLSVKSQQVILSALRDNFVEEEMYAIVREQLGQLTNGDMAEVARYPFTIAFNNILKNGQIKQQSEAIIEDRNPDNLDRFIQSAIEKDSDCEASPYYHMVLSPIMDRLDMLAESARAGARPPQYGDVELKALYESILNADTFQLR